MSHQFYVSSLGDRLVDDALLPERIRLFLRQEERLLQEVFHSFDSLVEVGSMHGLHLNFAAASAKPYLGLDIVERYVAEGNERVADLGLPAKDYRFLARGVEELGEISAPGRRPLVFAPFNCLGNITDLPGALNGLAAGGFPFLLSSYHTDPLSTRCREEYYSACGYGDVRMHRDALGVRFTATDGLDTVAYEPGYLIAQFADKGIEVEVVSFGDIGAAYISSGLLGDRPADARPALP
ncbi:hypothetical protein ACH4D3_13320 [Streptomyces sp. NPDC018026]|uniref:hypothetical protein n=1 Tax=Streptomyces sp. NPDC018026 TaxID=3365031 RepID=UPI0037BCDE7A